MYGLATNHFRKYDKCICYHCSTITCRSLLAHTYAAGPVNFAPYSAPCHHPLPQLAVLWNKPYGTLIVLDCRIEEVRIRESSSKFYIN